MRNGKIVEIGDTEEVFTNPQHEYTRELLSAVPIPDPQIARNRRHTEIDTDAFARSHVDATTDGDATEGEGLAG